MNIHKGSCHCGENNFSFISPQILKDIIPRTDRESCSFCLKNDGVWISDPNGQLEIHSKNISIYSFSSKAVKFCFCKNCGTLCYATFEDKYAVARFSCFPSLQQNVKNIQLTNFENESPEEGVIRRRKNWTPLVTYK